MNFDYEAWKLKRTSTKTGRVHKRYVEIAAFYEFHQRPDEPFPAVIMEAEPHECCTSKGARANICGKPAHYILKYVQLTKGRALLIRSDARCYRCFQYNVQRRRKQGRWIPKVLQEVCEHLMGKDWQMVCYRKFHPLKSPLKPIKPTKEEARARIAEILGTNRKAA